MYRLKFIYFFFILDLNLISMKLKLAKTMEDQEMNFKKKRQSSITYKELRNILKNVNIKESCQNHFTEENNIFRFEPQQTSFMNNFSIDDLAITFIDFSPSSLRITGVNSMLKMSKIVILHDSEEQRYKNIPKDFHYDSKFSYWNGKKAFTDCSKTLKYNLTTLSSSSSYKIPNSYINICTTVIKGETDAKDGLFEKLLSIYEDHFESLDSCYRHYNPKNLNYCSHLRLLIPASILSSGNIVELGSGDCSTPVLDDIMKDKHDNRKNIKLITVESDEFWLKKVLAFKNEYHELYLINSKWTSNIHRI